MGVCLLDGDTRQKWLVTTSIETATPLNVHVTTADSEEDTQATAQSTVTMQTHGETASNTYNSCVLHLYDYVQSVRDEVQDRSIKEKLSEIEKLIIGLNLRD